MDFRFLVDLEVVSLLDALPKKRRSRIIEHFGRLQQFPNNHSDYHETDSMGRHVEISIFAGYAIHYWIDSADRHIKVLAMKPADA
jgi:hypothetical protein